MSETQVANNEQNTAEQTGAASAGKPTIPEGIVPAYDNTVDARDFSFSFRKVTDEETKVETKRPTVLARLGIPSVEGIVAILQNGGKGLELLQQAVENVVTDYARSILNDDPSITTETFPYDKISWDLIANQPESERRGRGIPKEQWEAFVKSYIEHMPAILGKPLENIKKQASILAQKFQPLRTHENKNNILPNFVNALTLYTNNVPEAEQFADVLEYLVKKADQFINTDNSADLEKNLGF